MVPTVNLSYGIIYRFTADMDSLAAILEQLENLCPNSPSALVKKASTAIEELFTNSVCHGLRTEGALMDVGLAVLEADGLLHVRFEDGFLAFDPFQGLDATYEQAGLPTEERPIGGLGRLIVRGLSDQATYTRDGNINRVDLSFSLKLGY